jgi:hypothetical protein
MNKIKVIDNFLSKDEHLHIKSTLLNLDFPWYYSDWVSSSTDKNEEEFYFEHFFYQNFCIASNYFEVIKPILNKLEVKSLIRVKANLYPKVSHELLTNGFHSDQKYSHIGAVYYVNTNDGYTGFEDGTKIESIENRIMIFDSSIPHHSTHCTDQKIRLTMNFNYF